MAGFSNDKRRYPRVQATNISAHVNVADRTSPCTIQNISAGGLFIQTSDALPVGMPVAVSLARPGWTKMLRVSGRVVWAMAEKTAAKKGTFPGMRIRFDPLPKDAAAELIALLKDLGVHQTPPPPQLDSDSLRSATQSANEVTQPVSLRELERDAQPRVVPPGLTSRTIEPTPLARRAAAIPWRPDPVPAPAAPVPHVQPHFQSAAPKSSEVAQDAPRLYVQVQGLLMQLSELQVSLEAREREVEHLRSELRTSMADREKAERDKSVAELAVQKLQMQLARR